MPPTLRIISRTATPSGDIARCVLDRRGIPYGEKTGGGDVSVTARINDMQIPELVAGLARLPGLRRARGKSGHIAWDGPFPDHLVLAFDA